MQQETKSYQGDVKITSLNYKEWQDKLKDIDSITGYLYINSQAKLEANNLKSVGGYLYINSKNEKLERQLWQQNKKNKWYLNQFSSDWLFNKKAIFDYKINNVSFERNLFQKVRRDKLNAKKIFAITNIEQRRIAYEFMDKIKMKDLNNYKVLDEKKDKYNNTMKIVSFSIDGFTKPFKYLNCICPSTKREYFLETRQDTCDKAKSKSFGLDYLEFKEEW